MKESRLAYLSSSPLNEKMEISDVAINTGFALIVARCMGDMETASRIESYATSAFGASWDGGRYLYGGAARTLHSTALYALAAAISPGGEDFSSLFNAPPEPLLFSRPYLSQISGSDRPVGVSRARYDRASRTLDLAFRQIGEPGALRNRPPAEIRATLGNIKSRPRVIMDGVVSPESIYAHKPDGSLEVAITIDGARETSCAVVVS